MEYVQLIIETGFAIINKIELEITTSCWATIDRRMLKPTKKDTPHPETKGKPHEM